MANFLLQRLKKLIIPEEANLKAIPLASNRTIDILRKSVWIDTQLTVVVANGTIVGVPTIGMVLTGSTSGTTLTITHLGTDYAAGAIGMAIPIEGENMRNGANGFNTCTFTTNAFFYPTIDDTHTGQALFKTIFTAIPVGYKDTNVLIDIPSCSIKSVSTDKKLIRVNVRIDEDNLIQQATATADITLTGAEQDITGATLTLAEVGTYLITGVFYFRSIGDDGDALLGVLSVGGVSQSEVAALRSVAISGVLGVGESVQVDTNVRATVTQQWKITTTAVNTIAKLRAYKSGGAGTSDVGQTHTRISSIRQTSYPLAWAPAGLSIDLTILGEHNVGGS